GHLLSHEIEDVTGQLTAGTIRHVELVGLRFFEIEFEANRHAEAVAGPTRERYVHHAQDEVQAPQRTVFLSGGARAITVAGEPFDMGTSFFLGRVVEADANDFALGDTLGRQADDSLPELPAF